MIHLMKRYLRGFPLVCAILSPFPMFVEVWMDLQQPTLISEIVGKGVARRDFAFIMPTGEKMALSAVPDFLGTLSGAALSSVAAVKP